MTHEERFEIFWKEYPRKVGKGAARIKFVAKMKGLDTAHKNELLQVMLNTIAVFKTSPQWTKDNGAFIPHPATWIFQERWHDEYTAPAGIYTGKDDLEF